MKIEERYIPLWKIAQNTEKQSIIGEYVRRLVREVKKKLTCNHPGYDFKAGLDHEKPVTLNFSLHPDI